MLLVTWWWECINKHCIEKRRIIRQRPDAGCGVNPPETTTYVLDTAVSLTMVLAETTGTDTIYYLHGLDLVAQSDGTSTEYFVNDGLGSVRQLVDPVGEVLLAQTYDPYGNLYASAGVDVTAFGYTGEQEDANGLVFLRARYYSPSTGRFLNTDPSGQEANPYQYAASNPVMFTDLSGLFPTSDDYPIRPPSQYTNDETSIPVWYEGNIRHTLEFEPVEGFAGFPESVFEDDDASLPPQWRITTDSCDINMCWVASISAVTYMVQEGTTPQNVADILQDAGYATCNLKVKWQDLSDMAATEGIDLQSNEQPVDAYEKFYPIVRRELLNGKRAIALVGICGSTYDKNGKWLCGSYTESGSTLGEIEAYDGENGHFVVITGLSIIPGELSGWSNESLKDQEAKKWQWVRIFDPFDNWVEYHQAEIFYNYLAGGLVWMYNEQ